MTRILVSCIWLSVSTLVIQLNTIKATSSFPSKASNFFFRLNRNFFYCVHHWGDHFFIWGFTRRSPLNVLVVPSDTQELVCWPVCSSLWPPVHLFWAFLCISWNILWRHNFIFRVWEATITSFPNLHVKCTWDGSLFHTLTTVPWKSTLLAFVIVHLLCGQWLKCGQGWLAMVTRGNFSR